MVAKVVGPQLYLIQAKEIFAHLDSKKHIRRKSKKYVLIRKLRRILLCHIQYEFIQGVNHDHLQDSYIVNVSHAGI